MIFLLDILAYLLWALAGLCLLSLVLSLLKRPRERFPILRVLERRQLVLVLVACVAWILAHGATGWGRRLDESAWLDLSQGPQGELVQKATQAALREELKDTAAESSGQARAHFSAGERDLIAMRYREAAGSYERSVRALPTASGYLNLGISLLYIAEFRRAEDAFRSGIQMAQRRGNARMEGAYLDGLGRAALGLRRVDSALGCHRAALEIHTRIGNPLGRANAHANIGNAYLVQEKPGEALLSYWKAFGLYTRLENLLGRANALNQVGQAYNRLGRGDEALGILQEALALNTRIGNPLGQARDLAGIGNTHLARGKRREALEALRQSQAIYRRIGLGARDGQATDRMIERLNAPREGGRSARPAVDP
jgi:tetratricopeptide (TPR) repeat protein